MSTQISIPHSATLGLHTACHRQTTAKPAFHRIWCRRPLCRQIATPARRFSGRSASLSALQPLFLRAHLLFSSHPTHIYLDVRAGLVHYNFLESNLLTLKILCSWHRFTLFYRFSLPLHRFTITQRYHFLDLTHDSRIPLLVFIHFRSTSFARRLWRSTSPKNLLVNLSLLYQALFDSPFQRTVIFGTGGKIPSRSRETQPTL